MDWTWLISICIGIGLSASTGIRVFLPFFAIALAKKFELFEFGNHFDWLNGDTILISLAIATTLEIIAYYIPVIDHLLDIIATPIAMIAGIISMNSVMPDLPLYIDNILSIILGGTTAMGMNSLMGIWRIKTTASTAGVANPVFSTFENLLSGVFTFLSFLIPILFALVLGFMLYWLGKKIYKYFKKTSVTS